MTAEGAFVASILLGYIALGALAGTQNAGAFDVDRPAIRIASLMQLGLYVVGLVILALLLTSLPDQDLHSTTTTRDTSFKSVTH